MLISPCDQQCQIPRTELVETEDEERLVDLEAEDLRLNERQRLAVDLDQALALLGVGDRSGGLLLAEALDALDGRHVVGVVEEGGWSVGCEKSSSSAQTRAWSRKFRGVGGAKSST